MDNRREAVSPRQESSLFLQLRIFVPFTTETSQRESRLQPNPISHILHSLSSTPSKKYVYLPLPPIPGIVHKKTSGTKSYLFTPPLTAGMSRIAGRYLKLLREKRN